MLQSRYLEKGFRADCVAFIKDMAGARARLAQDPAAVATVNAAFGELCNAFAESGLAIVAVLEGAVMGGGFGLACVTDVAIEDDCRRLIERDWYQIGAWGLTDDGACKACGTACPGSATRRLR